MLFRSCSKEEGRGRRSQGLNLEVRNESGSMRQNQPKHNLQKSNQVWLSIATHRCRKKISSCITIHVEIRAQNSTSERHYDIAPFLACGVLQTTNVKCKFVTNLTISDAGLANTVKCTGCNKKCSTLFSIVSTKNRFFCKRVCMVEYLFLLSISQWNKEMRELRGKKKKINCLNAIKIFINLLLV